MKVRGGGKKTPLNTIKLYRMEVLSSETLDMSRSLHLIISYLS